MKRLTAEDILGAPRLKPVAVEVPEWGGVVFVRSLRAAELDELQFLWRSEAEREEDPNWRGRLVALCACDEQGRPLFGEHQASLVAQLDVAPLDRVFEAAQKLNGLSAKEKEAVRKNSPAPPNGEPSSASATG